MTVTVGHDSAKTRTSLTAGGSTIAYYSIPAAQAAGLGDFSNLPASLKVVLENMLRFEDGKTVTVDDIKAFAEWVPRVVGFCITIAIGWFIISFWIGYFANIGNAIDAAGK